MTFASNETEQFDAAENAVSEAIDAMKKHGVDPGLMAAELLIGSITVARSCDIREFPEAMEKAAGILNQHFAGDTAVECVRKLAALGVLVAQLRGSSGSASSVQN